MFNFLCCLSSSTMLSVTMTVGAIATSAIAAPALAQTPSPSPTPSPGVSYSDVNYFDVAPSYWAKPYIETLTQKRIIAGFPNGTFRPEQPVERAEFAAMIANAFEQNQVRPLAESGFRDVPSSYWATSAIQEAFQTGFMQGYGGGQFLPEQPIPRAQAITALAQGLRLSADGTPAEILRSSYKDAGSIPAYAIGPIAAATEANIVVNYPNVQSLNPLRALTRAEAAALLYQALVTQGRLEPISNNVAVTKYIVNYNSEGNQTTSESDTRGSATAATPTTSTTEPGDIYALSTVNFTTLSSVLKAAGLADRLKSGGPYTVFAPTDKAFAALPKETLKKLLQPENRDTLARILEYHMVRGGFTANELKGGELKTFADRPLNLKINRGTNQITVNDASVVQRNILASNGVIHAVDKVLLPPDINLNQLSK